MSARPPPARPHTAVRPSSFFGSGDWAEDDAWDSGSDPESPVLPPRSRDPSQSGSASRTSLAGTQPSFKPATGGGGGSAPKPVPRPANRSSSSKDLAFSFTHVNAPSPSSYPARDGGMEAGTPPLKNGWTLVSSDRERDEEWKEVRDLEDVRRDVDVDDAKASLPASTRARRGTLGTVRADVHEVLNDPLRLVHNPPPASCGSDDGDQPASEKLARERSIKSNRRKKFVDCLSADDVNISQLRKLAWAGIPDDLRPVAWPLLLGYLPLPAPLRASTLARKRNEYASLVELTFSRGREALDQQIWHQIEIDVPRTRPGVPLWMQGAAQRSLERILYVWAIRHPASGYVQGINDLVTPFFQVFLSAYTDTNPEDFDPALLPPAVLSAVEADSFWCLSRLLDGIQDNYIATQPGIHRSVRRMAELVARIDPSLAAHLEAQGVEFMQFAFRWMNCLLMREISVRNTIRMWDTYLAEGTDAFSQFHLYVCSAFLITWSEKLRQMDFQGIIMFLQSLPTQAWTDHDIELLLSNAFVLSSTWQNAQSHFGGR